MSETDNLLPVSAWPYTQILMRLALGLALGLLIGLERERRGKEAGLRTFGFIGLLGTMGGALGNGYGLATLALTGLLVLILNVSSLRAGQGTELTTSTAMLVTGMAGILCGLGHTIAPAAVMVIATALLAWKERLADFSMGVSEGEIRSAILLAVLAIVIYPALPQGAVGPWGLIEPRTAWVAVILIAGIGFFNYVLWKMYGTRGTELSGFFGGLINSNFTVIELVERVREVGLAYVGTAYRGIMLAMVAMIARNATLLLILAPEALVSAFSAFLLMMGASALLVGVSLRRGRLAGAGVAPEIHLDMPFSLPQALKYGAIFLLLHALGALTQRQFGDAGFYFVSIVGGLLSSANKRASDRGIEYLRIVSDSELFDSADPRQSSWRRSKSSFNRAGSNLSAGGDYNDDKDRKKNPQQDDLYNEVSNLQDFVPSLLALGERDVEDAATTLVVRKVLDQ
ncbi:MAG: MgtC/SapB family protein, partial [Burkholderiales bacterium]|nr:MgtC/SapB family protein [Burkholderiales bacterium]